MLRKLHIKNYALIKETEIVFLGGFTSITGETGAGKSVILGALGLLLGDRADLSAIPNKEAKCIIEGEFEIQRLNLEEIFEEQQWDYDPVTVLRREWLPTGKSRAFINDTPVQVQDLKLLSNYLLEIHSQHSALSITKPNEQLHALDIYANNSDTLNQYQTVHKSYQSKERLLLEMEQKLRTILQERDFKQFQLEELSQFQPLENEETILENEIELLSAAEEVVSICEKSGYLLSESEHSAYSLLSQIKQQLKSISSLSEPFQLYQNRLESLLAEVKDLSRDLLSSAEKTNPNPERLTFIQERYNSLQNLLKKHRVSSSSELISMANELRESEANTQELENIIANTRKELELISAQRQQLAEKLRDTRNQWIEQFANELQHDLITLEMPHVKVKLQLQSVNLGSTGMDSLQFLFSANKGIELQELHRCASGGELSRVNFCIRNLIAEKKSLPTLIYDEADTGVSGQVATRIGTLLRKQGGNQQVLAITHLPQVAAAGENHLFVFKSHNSEFSETQSKYLSDSERISEIAVMLSGNNPSASAMAAATDLIESYKRDLTDLQ